MTAWRRYCAIGIMAVAMSVTFGAGSSMAEPRAHVYLLRGLLNIFSLGMDSLAEELTQHGVYATVHNHTEWQSLADQAAANYKAGKEGPIIIIGHSLGADAAMQMAAYLGQKGVPVALAVPFDGTQTLVASSNIAHVLNLTQRNYAYVQRGAGFKGTLVNMNVSSDPSIDHINIDKSPRLHARVVSEVLGLTGGHRGPPTTTASTVTVGKPHTVSAPAESKPTEGPAVSPVAAPPVVPAQTPAPAQPPAPAKPAAGGASAPDPSPVAGISTSAPAASARTAN